MTTTDTQNLDGLATIVTGAGSGIGRAVAETLYQRGANVLVADISGAERQVADELGDRAIALNVDVTNEGAISEMIATATREFGGLDVLANVAGIDGELGPVEHCTVENFDRTVDVNLKGVFLGVKHAIPAMRERGSGSIINVASVAAIAGMPMLAVYGATKAGVAQLTKAAACEHAADNIRINAICPGSIDTPLVRELAKTMPDAVDAAMQMTPMGRQGNPSEMATVIAFLASQDSSFLTGAVIPADGGYSAW